MANGLVTRLNRKLSAAVGFKRLPIRPQRPIVTFTFDDAPRSAGMAGARILEDVGAQGTYYVAGGLCGREEEGRPCLTREDLVRLNDFGHELACHTFGHARVSALSSQAFRAEVERNQAFVEELCGDVRLRNFSYPFGDVTPGRKHQVETLFATGRGISPGVNSGTADLGLLKAVALYSAQWDERAIDGHLERAGRERGWLIFYTHDVEPEPSPWGTTPSHLEGVVAAAVARGYEVLTVRNALGRLAAPTRA